MAATNEQVSDGGGHQAPELAKERRPPPFAAPKSHVVVSCKSPNHLAQNLVLEGAIVQRSPPPGHNPWITAFIEHTDPWPGEAESKHVRTDNLAFPHQEHHLFPPEGQNQRNRHYQAGNDAIPDRAELVRPQLTLSFWRTRPDACRLAPVVSQPVGCSGLPPAGRIPDSIRGGLFCDARLFEGLRASAPDQDAHTPLRKQTGRENRNQLYPRSRLIHNEQGQR
jgi:hypothetical protein